MKLYDQKAESAREAVQRLGERFMDCEAYETVDGFWVVAVPAGRFEPDERDNHFEARMKGGIRFSELQGSITCGPVSLVLFENGNGGQVMANALVEVII